MPPDDLFFSWLYTIYNEKKGPGVDKNQKLFEKVIISVVFSEYILCESI